MNETRRDEIVVFCNEKEKSKLWNILNQVKHNIIECFKDLGLKEIDITMFEKPFASERTKPSIAMRNFKIYSSGKYFLTYWNASFELEGYGIDADLWGRFADKITQDAYVPYRYNVTSLDLGNQFTNSEIGVAYLTVTNE